jgi:hypothetical protein
MNGTGDLTTFLEKAKKKETITDKTMFTFLEINQALQKWSFEVVHLAKSISIHNEYMEQKAISDVILTRYQSIFQNTGMVSINRQHRKTKQCG